MYIYIYLHIDGNSSIRSDMLAVLILVYVRGDPTKIYIYIYIYVLHIDAHTCVIHHIYVDLPSARKKMLKVL